MSIPYQSILTQLKRISNWSYDQSIKFKYEEISVGYATKIENIVITKFKNEFKLYSEDDRTKVWNLNTYKFSNKDELYNAFKEQLDAHVYDNMLLRIIIIPAVLPIKISKDTNAHDLHTMDNYLDDQFNDPHVLCKNDGLDNKHYNRLQLRVLIHNIECKTSVDIDNI